MIVFSTFVSLQIRAERDLYKQRYEHILRYVKVLTALFAPAAWSAGQEINPTTLP